MPSRVERLCEIVSQASDIGPGGANNPTLKGVLSRVEKLNLMNRHSSGLSLHCDPLSRKLIQALALSPLRRIHRRNLLNDPPEGLEHRIDLARLQLGYGAHLDDIPRRIQGGRGCAKGDGCDVFLWPTTDIAREARRLPDTDWENAGCCRVERSSMTDLLTEKGPSNHLHDIVRCQAGRLIDDDQAIGCGRGIVRHEPAWIRVEMLAELPK